MGGSGGGGEDQEQRQAEEAAVWAEAGEGEQEESDSGGETGGREREGKRKPDGETERGRLQRKVARHARVEAAARAWDGRKSWAGRKVFRGDGRWLMAQAWARKAMARETKKERCVEVRKVCKEQLARVVEIWAAREREADGDKLVEGIKRAASKGHAQGGVYVALYEILRDAEGKGRANGDRRLKTLYKGGVKANGVVTGAEAVREEARRQGR